VVKAKNSQIRDLGVQPHIWIKSLKEKRELKDPTCLALMLLTHKWEGGFLQRLSYKIQLYILG
jgi:hypothetical protein